MKWNERPWSIPKQATRSCFACKKIVNSVLLQFWNRFCVNICKRTTQMDLMLSRNSSLKLKGWVFFIFLKILSIYIYIYIYIITYYYYLFIYFIIYFLILKISWGGPSLPIMMRPNLISWESDRDTLTHIHLSAFEIMDICGWLFLLVFLHHAPKSLLFPFLSFSFPFPSLFSSNVFGSLHPNRGGSKLTLLAIS